MMEVCAGVTEADGAVALGVRGSEISAIWRILYVESTLRGKKLPVASIPCRQDAIEDINSHLDRLPKVFRGSHPHQVARLFLRQPFHGALNHFQRGGAWLTEGQTAQCIPWKIEVDQLPRAFPA